MPIPRELRKLLAFGTGIGVEIGAADLEVVAARVRPTRVQVAGHLVIRNFAGRPAAEWGAEYGHFLKSMGIGHVSATVSVSYTHLDVYKRQRLPRAVC